MNARDAANRDLLTGLLALQNGLVEPGRFGDGLPHLDTRQIQADR